MEKMRNKTIMLSMLRNPIIAILLILLIGLVSYAFVGKAVETMIVWRETNRLEGYYRSIGYITYDWETGQEHLFSEAAEIIEQSPALAYDDLVKTTSAVMRDYYNLDFDSGTMDVAETEFMPKTFWVGEGVFNLDYWFYGTLIHYEKIYAEEDGKEFFGGYLLIFAAEEVVAGYPERIQSDKNYVMWIPARLTAEIDQMIPHLDLMEEGKRYLIRAWNHPSTNHVATNLPVSVSNARTAFNLKPLDGDDLWYLEVSKDEKVDLTLPEFKKLKLEIDRLNANLRTITLIGTRDMSAMPEMQQAAKWNYLVEGRWLNHQDELDSNKVIVIPEPFAKVRKIEIGDYLTVTIRSLNDPYYAYIRSQEDIENWENYPSQEISYEVVGIYSNQSFNYGKQAYFTDSYVPSSTIGDEFVMPYFFSPLQDKYIAYNFVLKNPRTQDAFIDEYDSKMSELGFVMEFVDNNGRNFMAGADPLRRSTILSLLLFSIALLIAIALSIFLYLRQNKKNAAIMRALGVPAQSVTRQLLFPLLGLGFIGATLGSFLSWQNAHGKAAESLSNLPLPSGVFPELALNPLWGMVFWLLILLILLIGTSIGIKKIIATPILELLQGEQTKTKKTKIKKSKQPPLVEDSIYNTESIDLARISAQTPKNKTKPWIALKRYSSWSTLRAPVKSLLTIGVAASMLLAMGWLRDLINKNEIEIDRLYRTTQIEIDIKSPVGENNLDFFNNQIGRYFLEELLRSGFVADTYLSSALIPELVMNNISGEFEQIYSYHIVAVSDLEIGTHSRLNLYGEINWLSGYGPDDISELWSDEDVGNKPVPLIITESHKDQEGWELGDVISIELVDASELVNFKIVGEAVNFGVHVSKYLPGGEKLTLDPLVTNLSAIEKHYDRGIQEYLEVILYSEPSMNYRISEFKEGLEKRNLSPLEIRFWDEELLAVVEPMERNLSLMERLYPVTLLISGVIGATLCFLLIMNQVTETAMLRMLGVSKKNIRTMQVSQILLLSVIGLIVGMVVFTVLRGPDAFQSVGIAALVYLLGALFGSLLGTNLVVSKKPMELLQVKE